MNRRAWIVAAVIALNAVAGCNGSSSPSAPVQNPGAKPPGKTLPHLPKA